jgi:hypothetical protein
MNTSILKVGQVIKNYDELCYLLEEQPRECSKHKKHFDEFKMFFNYHRKGNNIIIDEVYDKSKIKINMTQIEYDEYIDNWKKENHDLLHDTNFKKYS